MGLVNGIDCVLMAFNLGFAAYICIRLLVPLRIKGTFIIQFYLVSVLFTVMRIIEVSNMIADPNQSQWEDGFDNYTFLRVDAILATCTFFALGLLVISTMF